VSKSAEGVRVTFDRHIVGHKYQVGCGLETPADASAAVTKGVVLELKYNGRAPRWMHDLVTTLSLQRLSFPKYVYCVEALGIDPDRSAATLRGGGEGVMKTTLARSVRR
jgi:VTC domain